MEPVRRCYANRLWRHRAITLVDCNSFRTSFSFSHNSARKRNGQRRCCRMSDKQRRTSRCIPLRRTPWRSSSCASRGLARQPSNDDKPRRGLHSLLLRANNLVNSRRPATGNVKPVHTNRQVPNDARFRLQNLSLKQVLYTHWFLALYFDWETNS